MHGRSHPVLKRNWKDCLKWLVGVVFKRHPQLCLRKAEKLSYACSKSTDPIVLEKYFDLLERTLEEYDLCDSPGRIFNCDGTGLCYDHKPPAVVGIKGQHHPRAITSGNKRQTTVLARANAAGCYLPTLVIFKRKTLPLSILDGEIPGTLYSLSDSGWVDAETFDHWFFNSCTTSSAITFAIRWAFNTL